MNANGYIASLCADASGNIYVAGNFTNSSGKYYVAKYNGTSWIELGGLNGLSADSFIYSICSDPSGNIYAAGAFKNSSGNYYLAKYNGTIWSELGGLNDLGANGTIQSICSDQSGNIYSAGNFTNNQFDYYVAQFNGSTWSELGGVGAITENGNFNTGPIASLCTDPTGNIYAAGNLKDASGNYYVARYGSAPAGINEVGVADAIRISPNPAANAATISLVSPAYGATIRVLDITGQTIMQKTNQSGSKFTLDLSAIRTGIYFIEVAQEGRAWTGKLVKAD